MSGMFGMNCGSDIIHPECRDLVYTLDDDGFKAFFGELVSDATIILTITISMAGSSLGENMNKAMNAIRCAYISGAFNFWKLMGAFYYFLHEL